MKRRRCACVTSFPVHPPHLSLFLLLSLFYAMYHDPLLHYVRVPILPPILYPVFKSLVSTYTTHKTVSLPVMAVMRIVDSVLTSQP